MYGGIYVQYPLFLLDFNATWIFSTDFEKPSNIKFNENPPHVGWVILCAQTDGQTDMTKLMVTILRTRLQTLL
jgi:hypothetical protein